MKIYTKGGDTGETGLFGGKRIRKGTERLHAYGSVDELNAVLGRARTLEASPRELDQELGTLQSLLFVLGSDLATPRESPIAVPRISAEHTSMIEQWIDAWETTLQPLTTFILPGGSALAAELHIGRTVCRRAERWLSALAEKEEVNPAALAFLNRVSDYLFVTARIANKAAGFADITVEPRKQAGTQSSAPRKARKARGVVAQ